MLLLVDMGNTHTVVGLWEGASMVKRWRVASEAHRTADEFRILLRSLLEEIDHQPEGAAISSVVPQATQALRNAVASLVAGPVVVVGPGVKTGLAINIDNPREVGADRVVNAIGAVMVHGSPVVVLDFGTATTVDLVGADGSYRGGAIAPGIEVAAESLVASTAALRRVELVVPPSPVGKSTVEAMQSGLLYGFAGLVDGLVERVLAELGTEAPVVATGGLADLIIPLCKRGTTVDQDLTLRGLAEVFRRNQS
ncbi:MAG TPA: type III pantothenate kinase [Acidimicrobiia bacterium]|jgi:type III pantothenate kinase